jgi:hypothetical protein
VTDDTTRATAAKILRAVADLIETTPEIPVPSADISFYVRGDSAPAMVTAVATSLPCEWQSSISRGSSHEWLNMCSAPGRTGLRGAVVRISAPAADVCVQAGARTVTVWQPGEALTGLLGTEPLGDDQ